MTVVTYSAHTQAHTHTSTHARTEGRREKEEREIYIYISSHVKVSKICFPQDTTQYIMFFLAILSIPVLLIVKPVYLICCRKSKGRVSKLLVVCCFILYVDLVLSLKSSSAIVSMLADHKKGLIQIQVMTSVFHD